MIARCWPDRFTASYMFARLPNKRFQNQERILSSLVAFFAVVANARITRRQAYPSDLPVSIGRTNERREEALLIYPQKKPKTRNNRTCLVWAYGVLLWIPASTMGKLSKNNVRGNYSRHLRKYNDENECVFPVSWKVCVQVAMCCG